MERIDDLIDRLREAARNKHLNKRERDTIEIAIYELENGFNPADGIWIVKQNGRRLSKFADLSEVETLDVHTLAKLETRRDEACRAMVNQIEDTKRDMPNGETWWTFDGQSVIDAIFRAVIEKE